jgi:hypothetical protein
MNGMPGVYDSEDPVESSDEYIHSIRLIAGMWSHVDKYERMREWVNECNGCQIDHRSGWSSMNGSIFYTRVKFINIEDKLAFALTFSEFVV